MNPTQGRIWRLGDNIDTDLIAPGRYMKFDIDEIAHHCLEDCLPTFAASVRPGDVIVAGRNFGMGSSREQAPQALKQLGVAAVIAESFAGLFYRNAYNLGLPALVCPNAAPLKDQQRITLHLVNASLVLPTGQQIQCEPIPANLLAILLDGGLMPHLKKRLSLT